MNNYTLKYRTFDNLIDDCSVDFKKYKQFDMIDKANLIGTARRCNYELGLRIYQNKEKVLEVNNGRVRLPNDFYVINYALVLGKYTWQDFPIQAGTIEEKIVGKVKPAFEEMNVQELNPCTDFDPIEPTPCDPCTNPCCPQCGNPTPQGFCVDCCRDPRSCKISCKGELINVVQTYKTQWRSFEVSTSLKIVSNVQDFNDFCEGKYFPDPMSATIENGWLYTSFKNGNVYLNYLGDMEDEHGNLLVPDHEELNNYYEYAIKRKILENIFMNDSDSNINVLSAKIQLIEQRYVESRRRAHSLVNTPNFKELKELFEAKRNAMYSKYYDMFASKPRIKSIR